MRGARNCANTCTKYRLRQGEKINPLVEVVIKIVSNLWRGGSLFARSSLDGAVTALKAKVV